MAGFLDRFCAAPASERKHLLTDLPIARLLFAGLRTDARDIEHGWRVDAARGSGLDYVYKAFTPADYKMTDSEFRACIERIFSFTGLHDYEIKAALSENEEHVQVVSVRRQNLIQQATIIHDHLPVLEADALRYKALQNRSI